MYILIKLSPHQDNEHMHQKFPCAPLYSLYASFLPLSSLGPRKPIFWWAWRVGLEPSLWEVWFLYSPCFSSDSTPLLKIRKPFLSLKGSWEEEALSLFIMFSLKSVVYAARALLTEAQKAGKGHFFPFCSQMISLRQWYKCMLHSWLTGG